MNIPEKVKIDIGFTHFETVKKIFLQVKKFLMGLFVFFFAKRRKVSPKVDRVWLSTFVETAAKKLSTMKFEKFYVKLEHKKCLN